MSRRYFKPGALAYPLVTLLLAACSSGPGLEQAQSAFRAQQLAAAEAALSDGDPARALRLWRTVLTLDPEDESVAQTVARLEAELADSAAEAVTKGKAAYARGERRSGDRWMLEALAQQPANPEALAALRRSVSEASHARQEEKIASQYASVAEQEQSEEAAEALRAQEQLQRLQALYDAREYRAVLTAAADAPASIEEAVNTLVHNAHLGLAVDAYKAGETERQLQHLEESLATAGPRRASLSKQATRLRRELSDSSYKQGLALMKTDIDGAILALEGAVRFRPDNIAAKEKLDQAITIRKNLQRIIAE